MSELWGIARSLFDEGQLERSQAPARAEPWRSCGARSGRRQYRLCLNADQSECAVLERYRDSGAARAHASTLGDLFGAVLATVTVVRRDPRRTDAEPSEKLAGSESRFSSRPTSRWNERDLETAV